MPLGRRGSTLPGSLPSLVGMLCDLIGALLLLIYAILVRPLGILRTPIACERAFWYLWVLLPQGLMTRSIRAAIDWRLGHFDAAISQVEGLVSAGEECYKACPTSRARRRVLEDLYTVLTRAYLHAGHIDDAMLVVIRAKKTMAIDRLGGLAELDAKTAHLVRAGIAAGRLLDGGGLAAMFVKSSQTEATPPAAAPRRPAPDKETSRAGASARSARPRKLKGDQAAASSSGAKIIPFPLPGGQA